MSDKSYDNGLPPFSKCLSEWEIRSGGNKTFSTTTTPSPPPYNPRDHRRSRSLICLRPRVVQGFKDAATNTQIVAANTLVPIQNKLVVTTNNSAPDTTPCLSPRQIQATNGRTVPFPTKRVPDTPRERAATASASSSSNDTLKSIVESDSTTLPSTTKENRARSATSPGRPPLKKGNSAIYSPTVAKEESAPKEKPDTQVIPSTSSLESNKSHNVTNVATAVQNLKNGTEVKSSPRIVRIVRGAITNIAKGGNDEGEKEIEVNRDIQISSPNSPRKEAPSSPYNVSRKQQLPSNINRGLHTDLIEKTIICKKSTDGILGLLQAIEKHSNPKASSYFATVNSVSNVSSSMRKNEKDLAVTLYLELAATVPSFLEHSQLCGEFTKKIMEFLLKVEKLREKLEEPNIRVTNLPNQSLIEALKSFEKVIPRQLYINMLATFTETLLYDTDKAELSFNQLETYFSELGKLTDFHVKHIKKKSFEVVNKEDGEAVTIEFQDRFDREIKIKANAIVSCLGRELQQYTTLLNDLIKNSEALSKSISEQGLPFHTVTNLVGWASLLSESTKILEIYKAKKKKLLTISGGASRVPFDGEKRKKEKKSEN